MQVIGNFNLYDDIIGAKEQLLNNNVEIFNKYSPVYPWSNEKLSKYYDLLDMKGKSILCPTGSGDHALEALLNGAKEIICYDIDALSKYYSELKFSQLIYLTYERFINLLKDDFDFIVENIYSEPLFKSLKQILSDDVYLLWSCLLEFNNIDLTLMYLNNDFPHNIKWLCDNLSYLNNKEIYNNVRKKLKEVDIKYVDSNISDLGQILPDKKFDYIFTSNILDYFDRKEAEQIIKMLYNLLNENGKIISYTMNDSVYKDGKLIYDSSSNERYNYDGICVYSYKK